MTQTTCHSLAFASVWTLLKKKAEDAHPFLREWLVEFNTRPPVERAPLISALRFRVYSSLHFEKVYSEKHCGLINIQYP